MPDPAAADPRRPLDEQMVTDWAAVGVRRLEAHLALHAAFCEFLRRQSRDAEDREQSWPHGQAR